MRFRNLLLLICASVSQTLIAQTVNRIDPPNWWVGFEDPQVELLVHGKDLAGAEVSIDGKGVSVAKVEQAENPNYLFVTLKADQGAQPGSRTLQFKTKKGKTSKAYEFKARTAQPKGLDASDFIYLIFPDRFSNGDASNDVVKGLKEGHVDRDSMFHRHGGDLKGIQNHLDYLKEVGATAVWINPVYTNDQPEESYHGYAITDHYEVDPRFGSMSDYIELVKACHGKDLKVIKDVVFNHVGNEHYFFQDLPMANWVHQHDSFTKTSYRAPTLIDPYASTYDRELMTDGWFDKHMPDLNQKNPHVSAYLIQQCIWWVELTGLDAFRIDTYAYSDLGFMKDLATRMMQEFPTFEMFGETWVHGTPIQAFFTKDNDLVEGYNSGLSGVTDFQLYYAINNALTKDFGWKQGASELYYTLAKDILYDDPYKNVTFLDNHDLSRFYSMVGEDFRKYKMGLGFILTTRGIPMIYYGTEVLMKNMADPDGKVREDFPGGWEGDKTNYFKPEGRTGQTKEAFDYVAKLANFRKAHKALQDGKLMQFIPDNGVYKYARYNDDERFIMMMNTNDDDYQVDTKSMGEIIGNSTSAINVVTGETITDLSNIAVEGWSLLILQLN